MEKLIIVRHGKSEATRDYPDLGLTEEGKSQVANLGQRLKGVVSVPALMLASSSLRGVESANILAQVINPEIIPLFNDLLWHDSYHRGGRFEESDVRVTSTIGPGRASGSTGALSSLDFNCRH